MPANLIRSVGRSENNSLFRIRFTYFLGNFNSRIKGRSINGFVVACVYTACREAGALSSMEEISRAIDTDKVFAGKGYRLLSRRLRIKFPEKFKNETLNAMKDVVRCTEPGYFSP